MANQEAIRARLEAERTRLRAEIERQAEVLPAYDGTPTESRYGNHPADQATDTFEEQKAVALRAHFQGELAEVDEALRRLDSGRYGVCEQCGRVIDPERLAAVPYTRLCADCKRRSEARR